MNANKQIQPTRKYSNLLRIGALICMISGSLLLSLLILPVSQASPGALPPAAPSPRPPVTEGSDKGDSGSPGSAIYGKVTDLSRQQPGQAIEIVVNGAIVRTDTDGSYSVTGLNAGDYTIALELHGQGEPAQGPVHVSLDGSHNAVIDLDYYSQAAPTDTPQPSATAPAVSAASTPAALPDSGAPLAHRPPGLIILGLLLLALGLILFNQSQVKPGHKSSIQID
jgi:hypothetical protein